MKIPALLLPLVASAGFPMLHAETVAVAGEEKPLAPLVMGINDNVGSLQAAIAGGNEDLYWRAYQVANPTLIRYPGGTVASLWDFENDRFYPEEVWADRLGKHTIWMSWTSRLAAGVAGTEDRSHLSPEHFAKKANEMGAEVAWVVNLATDPKDEKPHAAVKFIQRLLDSGIKPRYVELGNEFEGASFVERWPSVEDYLAEIEPIVAAIREIAPDVKLSYPSSVPTNSIEADENNRSGELGRHGEWAGKTLAKKDGIDLVNHTYIGVRGAEQAVGLKKYVAWVRAEKADPMLGARFVVQNPAHMVPLALEHMHGSGKKIWQTEYNLWMPPGRSGGWERYSSTMTNALYMANWQLLMLQNPETFEMSNWHSLTGAVFGFVTFNKEKDGLEVSPAVELFSQLSTVVRQSKSIRTLGFPDGPQLEGLMIWEGKSAPALIGVQFSGDAGDIAVITNSSESPAIVRIGEGKIDVAKSFSVGVTDPLEQIRKTLPSDAKAPIREPLPPVALTITDGAVTLPPFSYSQIVLNPE